MSGAERLREAAMRLAKKARFDGGREKHALFFADYRLRKWAAAIESADPERVHAALAEALATSARDYPIVVNAYLLAAEALQHAVERHRSSS